MSKREIVRVEIDYSRRDAEPRRKEDPGILEKQPGIDAATSETEEQELILCASASLRENRYGARILAAARVRTSPSPSKILLHARQLSFGGHLWNGPAKSASYAVQIVAV